MNSPPPETCLSRKTPFQYCLIVILSVTVPFFFVMLGIHIIYLTTNLGQSEKCENLCFKLKNELNRSDTCDLGNKMEDNIEHVTYRHYQPKMNFQYKDEVPFKGRKIEGTKLIRQKPQYIPVIIEKDPGALLTIFGDPLKQLKVRKSQTGFEFKESIAKGVNGTIYLFVNDKLMPLYLTMGEIHERFHENDNVLYVVYTDSLTTDFKPKQKLIPKMHFQFKKENPFRKRLLQSIRFLITGEGHVPIIFEKDPTSNMTITLTRAGRFQADKTLKDLYDYVSHKTQLNNVWLFVHDTLVENTPSIKIETFYLDNYEDDNFLYMAYTDNPDSLFVPLEDYYKIGPEVLTSGAPPYTYSRVPFGPRNQAYNTRKQEQIKYCLHSKPNHFRIQYDLKLSNGFVASNYLQLTIKGPVRRVEVSLKFYGNTKRPLYLYLYDRLLTNPREIVYELIDKYLENDNIIRIYATDEPIALDTN